MLISQQRIIVADVKCEISCWGKHGILFCKGIDIKRAFANRKFKKWMDIGWPNIMRCRSAVPIQRSRSPDKRDLINLSEVEC